MDPLGDFIRGEHSLTLSEFSCLRLRNRIVYPSTAEKGGKNIYVERADGVEFYNQSGRLTSSLDFPHDGYFVDAGGYLALSQRERLFFFDKNGKTRAEGTRAETRVYQQEDPFGFHLECGKAKSQLKAAQKKEVKIFRGNSTLPLYNKFHFLPWGEILLVNYSEREKTGGRKNWAAVCDPELKVVAEINFDPKPVSHDEEFEDFNQFPELRSHDLNFFDSFLDEEGTLIVLGEKGIAVVPLGETPFHLSVDKESRVVSFGKDRGKFVLRVPGDRERVLF